MAIDATLVITSGKPSYKGLNQVGLRQKRGLNRWGKYLSSHAYADCKYINSSTAIEPLAWLHERQAVTQLDAEVSPPLLLGRTWSIVKLAVEPQ